MSLAGASGFTLDKSGLFFRCDELVERGLVAHAFSTRLGGESEGPFQSLNLGLHVGDRPEAVLENRRRLLSLLGAGLEDLVAASQVHGDRVTPVGRAEAGRGAVRFSDAIARTDALIAKDPGVALSVYVADCVPAILFDPVRKVVGAVHAGWRGAAAGVVAGCVRAMGRFFGTNPEDLIICFGPAIGPCCYEVGPEVEEAVRRGLGPEASRAVLKGNDSAGSKESSSSLVRLDLWEVNGIAARQSGVKPANIHACRLCTACEEELFFSYRRDGKTTGRMAAVAVVPGGGGR